jgi:hypothetical protein
VYLDSYPLLIVVLIASFAHWDVGFTPYSKFTLYCTSVNVVHMKPVLLAVVMFADLTGGGWVPMEDLEQLKAVNKNYRG